MSDAPNELGNSRRRFEKATYTPIKTLGPEDPNRGDALVRAALVRTLELMPEELTALRATVGDAAQAAIDTIRNAANAVTADSLLRSAAQLAQIPASVLASVAQALKEQRRGRVCIVLDGLRALDRGYVAATAAAVGPTPAAPVATTSAAPDGDNKTKASQAVVKTSRPSVDLGDVANLGATAIGALGADAAGGMTTTPSAYVDAWPLAATTAATGGNGSGSSTASSASPQLAALPAPGSLDPVTAAALGPALALRLPAVTAWAAANQPAALSQLQLQLASMVSLASTRDLGRALAEAQRRGRLVDLFLDALTRRPLEPVGLLHLERLEMTPLDVQRGELSYSLPLAPREKVTLAHKVWATTEQQFSEYIEDFFENYSEKGVAQSEDISMATQTQSDQQNGVSVSQTSAAANAVTITPPADGTQPQSVVDDSTSKSQSKSQSRAVTEKASARATQDHKVSFTVTTVSGIQDFTARVIENPHDDQAMQVDYYKRMQRWHSVLLRYGVRLTYDVVLPDPGRILRGRVLQMKEIVDALSSSFEFSLAVSDIKPKTYQQYAAQYGVTLPTPPEPMQTLQKSIKLNYPPFTPIQIGNQTFQLNESIDQVPMPDIPGGYYILAVQATIKAGTWDNVSPKWAEVFVGSQSSHVDAVNGRINAVLDFTLIDDRIIGPFSVNLMSRGIAAGSFDVTVSAVPSEATYDGWALRCWGLLHDAAFANWQAYRSQLRDRLSTLQRLVSAEDTVILRRREREQIMRLVLSWLFPGFDDANSVLEGLPNPGELDTGTWQKVMEYGEYIKFVHSAIDWDNVVVFLYPYFWDTFWHQADKLFLDHPDPIHREFLRAGAARVVLAVRPGFEAELVSLLDQGQLGTLANGGQRFQKVIGDVQRANAAYEQSTSTSGEDPPLPGVAIGQWHDFTPLGALEIDVSLKKVATT
jgi:hypothetical protein